MRLFIFGVAAFGLFAVVSSTSPAASDMSDAEYRAAIAACKVEANPQKRDECVSNAKNRYEKGKGAQKKASDAAEDAEKGTKGKAKAKIKGKADSEMKGVKDKGKQMMKTKGKRKK